MAVDGITAVSFHWIGDSPVVLLAYKENQESWRWVPSKKRKRIGKHRAVYTTVNLSGHQTTIALFFPRINHTHSPPFILMRQPQVLCGPFFPLKVQDLWVILSALHQLPRLFPKI